MKGVIKLSIKNEIPRLRERETYLVSEFVKVGDSLNRCFEERRCIIGKLNVFKIRSSNLAKKLARQIEGELANCDKRIAELEIKKKEVEESLNDIRKKLSDRLEDTTLYIQEQLETMIPRVLEYIRKHQEEIGYDLQRTFIIKDLELQRNWGPDCFNAPIGDIMVQDSSNNFQITVTDNCYFENKLYDVEIDSYGVHYVAFTSWYEEYFNNFVKLFMSRLEKDFCFADSFKLTIDNNKFTLELV